MVVPLDRRDTCRPQDLSRVTNGLSQQGQRRRPLEVDVLREQRADTRDEVGRGTLTCVTGVDAKAFRAAANPLRQRSFDGVAEGNGMLFDAVRIRALSVFESVVYHCFAVDVTNPCKPTLEVDARTLPGDLDAGPLLVTVADWRAMLLNGGVGRDVADACLPELKRRRRLVTHLDVVHIAFPTWTSVEHQGI